MQKFTHAIVRTPCRNMIQGLTSANLGEPDYVLAREQHTAYIEALEVCGLDVTVLPPDEFYPDSTFVEDTALLTPHCAIIANPGAKSRRGEITEMVPAIRQFYETVEFIQPPGTVEPGDIMMVGDHYYIGLSKRTNAEGAEQMTRLLQMHGMSASVVPLQEMLHLKTGVAYLENMHLAAAGEFIEHPEFQQFNIIPIDEDEAYAANCIWVNGTVLVAAGFPKTKDQIEDAGYNTIALDMSEFQKLDGGLSCLSLRF